MGSEDYKLYVFTDLLLAASRNVLGGGYTLKLKLEGGPPLCCCVQPAPLTRTKDGPSDEVRWEACLVGSSLSGSQGAERTTRSAAGSVRKGQGDRRPEFRQRVGKVIQTWPLRSAHSRDEVICRASY